MTPSSQETEPPANSGRFSSSCRRPAEVIVVDHYERASTIVTSNKSFESWAEVFPDSVIASAVLDRLVHHAHLVPIVGESFRMKELKTRRASKGGTSATHSA